MTRPRTLEESLAPLRDRLLRTAEATADRTTGEAEQAAAEAIGRARRTAEQLLDTARREGEADNAALLAAQRSRVRRRTRATVLRAQERVRDELGRRSLDAAARLRTAPEYPAWRDGLVRVVRAELGEGAQVVDHPDGGVVGVAGSRRIDVSLPVLVQRALEREAVRLEQLWTEGVAR